MKTQHDIKQVEGPIVRKETLPNGMVRTVTHWIIKGEQTQQERFTVGFPTMEALLGFPVSTHSNIVYVGIEESQFSDGSSVFYRLCNVWD